MSTRRTVEFAQSRAKGLFFGPVAHDAIFDWTCADFLFWRLSPTVLFTELQVPDPRI
jgi:hypothetical protein